jgi:hypothetical protein
MNRRLIISALIAASVAGFSNTANAGGFLADIIRPVAPGVADAADGWSREWQRRDSDASVGSQLLCGVGCWGLDQPFRPAQGGPGGGPAPAVLGNRCTTPMGIFAPGPWDQVGAPCHGNGPYGPIPGQVIQ